jgi:hypothetical protein
MLSQALLDERFLDRGGASDELYGDLREEVSQWLDDLLGERALGGNGFDVLDDRDGTSFDEFAAH